LSTSEVLDDGNEQGTAVKPNILVIVADDLGWNAIGYHNDDVKTPNIDERLCAAGVELDRFYSSPMCSPARAGLMTGRYPIRFGCAQAVIPPHRDQGVPTEEVFMPEVLAHAGYEQRAMLGKWHLGHRRRKWLPLERGFTEFYGHYNGAIDYFTHEREGELDWHRGYASSHDEGYATDLIADETVAFVRRHAGSEEPFFCYTAFNAPHGPFQAPQAYIDRYAHIEDETTRVYFAMITAMDDGIGRILDALDDEGISDDTLIWFFSDNGGWEVIERVNHPLRGGKLTTFDGGVRVVSCVRYPGTFPAGTKVGERTGYLDLLPTLMDCVGIDDTGGPPLDGLNLFPLLRGQDVDLPTRPLHFFHGQNGLHDEHYGIIDREWKLVVIGHDIREGETSDHESYLFHLEDDPLEETDLKRDHPDIHARLMASLIEMRSVQPEGALPAVHEGKEGFVAPKAWNITS
jgi:arylsulfatase B